MAGGGIATGRSQEVIFSMSLTYSVSPSFVFTFLHPARNAKATSSRHATEHPKKGHFRLFWTTFRDFCFLFFLLLETGNGRSADNFNFGLVSRTPPTMRHDEYGGCRLVGALRSNTTQQTRETYRLQGEPFTFLKPYRTVFFKSTTDNLMQQTMKT